MKTTMRALSLSLLALTFTANAATSDWPQWRGPKRDGVSGETGLLEQWPAGGPKLVWKGTGLGGGYSTPSVANGRLYGMGYKGGQEAIWAVDANSGKVLWSTPIGSASQNMGYPEGTRSTPTVDGDALYAIGAGGTLICVDAASGKLRWKKDFVSEFGGRMMSRWGFTESPLVDGEQVVCTPGGTTGTIVALNKKTGAVLWQTKDFTDRAAYSSIIVTDIAGTKQYVQLTGEHVVGVAPNGKLLWSAERLGKTAVIPTPIEYNDHVFVTSSYDIGCNLFKVTGAGQAFKAQEVYANKNMANHHGGVVLVGDHLYGFSDSNRSWVCMKPLTGEIVWQHRGVGKGAITYADGLLYLRGEGQGKGGGPSDVALIVATPKGYEEKGRFTQPDRSDKNSWPHPVIANGRLYLRDQDVLLCYDVKAK
ncbi:MAG: PQQ-binding-like beta-propeller repeat protein [Verrucomicrobiota bacterium]